MAFIRVEDRMPRGPKFAGIPPTAGWLYVCALCYAAHTLTDGFIPTEEVYKLTKSRRSVVDRDLEWLTSVRPGCTQPLMHVVVGGYFVHDYGDPEYGNPTRAVADVLREAAQRGGKRSAEVRRRRFGTAQPTQKPEPHFEPHFGTASAEVPPEVSARSVPEARPAPPRTTPSRTTEPDGSSVEGFSPKATSGGNAPARRAAAALTSPTNDHPDALAYAARWMERRGLPPSPDDREFFSRVPYECDRLSRDAVLAAIDELFERFKGRDRMPPAKYLAGPLSDLQRDASDAGVTERSRSPNGSMTRASDVLAATDVMRDIDDE